MATATQATADAKKILPQREANLWRQLLRLYEVKQYKKAVKAADQILKKCPEHGETLAMKGLAVYYMPGADRKAEAYELVRLGVRHDLKSYTCWHVYGLLYRADQNYPEAIKCYRNSLRFDPQNQQILRDLAMLQVQVRDLGGFCDTRSALLHLKPQARTNWLALAVAHHLAGSHDVAVEVLRGYESTQEAEASGGGGGSRASGGGGGNANAKKLSPQELADAYEESELVLYRAVILREAGRPKDALAWLRERRDEVRDRSSYATIEAACLLEAADKEEAEAAAAGGGAPSSAAALKQEAAKAYRAMLRDNPDDLDAHRGLRCALGLLPGQDAGGAGAAGAGGAAAAAAASSSSSEAAAAAAEDDHGGSGGGGGGGAHEDALLTDRQRAALRALYAGLRADFPRSGAAGRAPLDFEAGGTAEFAAAAEAYVRRPLQRGVPSLFSDLRPLYADAAKAAALGALMEGLRDAVAGDGNKLPPLSAAAEAAAKGVKAAAGAGGDDDAANNNNNVAERGGGSEGPPPCPTGWLAAALNDGNGDDDNEEEEEGGVRTWVLHYLAQHYDELGRTADALAASDAAMASSGGRVPEVWLARARLLKRAGDAAAAAAAAARASALDPSDRYLNSMAARYLLSAGDVVTAQRAAGVFTRGTAEAAVSAAAASASAPGTTSAAAAEADADAATAASAAASASASLAEMQHSWFELRQGEARLAQSDLGRALKHFVSVAGHFAEFVDDQLDFHQWCLRRSTLRQYVSLIRLADSVRAHPQHARAVWGAVRAYCALADAEAAKEAAAAAGGGGGGGANGAGAGAGKGGGGDANGGAGGASALTPEERKKEQLRRKKEQKAAEQQQQQAAAAAAAAAARDASSSGGGGGKQQRAAAAAAKPADPDPDGAKLAAVEDPMAEAAKLVRVLAEHAPNRLITQRCAFETYLRRGRPVLALAAAERAAALAGPRNPEAFRMAARLALALCEEEGGASPSPCAAVAAKNAVVGEVVREGVARLLLTGGGAAAAAASPAAPAAAASPSELPLTRARVRAFVDAYAKAADQPAAVPRPAPSAPGAAPLLSRPSPVADARAGRADDPRSSALARRAAAAEMTALVSASAAEGLALLPEAQLLAPGARRPSHADCAAVHRLLVVPAGAAGGGPLADAAAAERWRARAAELFPWSAYFGGAKSSSGGGKAACNGGA